MATVNSHIIERNTISNVWAIDANHSVTYTQSSYVGWFGKSEGAATKYTCSCGKIFAVSHRALKSDLELHDTWKTAEELSKNSHLEFMRNN